MAGIAHALSPGHLRRGLHIGSIKHHIGVSTAKFEHALLQVLTSLSCNDPASTLRTGERNALHSWVFNQLRNLIMRGKDIRVGPCGQPSFIQNVLDLLGGTGTNLGVFDEHHIARHQCRCRKTRDLVVGKVPRHDAQNHAERDFAHHRSPALVVRNFLVSAELGAMVGVVVENLYDVIDLSFALFERFAHFFGDDAGEGVTAGVKK